MAKSSGDKPTSSFEFLLALSATSLCAAITLTSGFLNRGDLDVIAILLLSLALLLNFAALLFPKATLPRFAGLPLLRLVAKAPVHTIFLISLAMQWMMLGRNYPTLKPLFLPIPILIVLALAAFSSANREWTKLKIATLGALLLVFFCCGIGIFAFIPGTPSDVIIFQRDALNVLLAGKNPYAITFPDIYGGNSPYYGPGVSVNGVLQFGFPYPPLVLLWLVPAQMLFGDFRYGHLLALTVGAAFLVALRPAPVVLLAALSMVLSVPAFFVLRVGWTEPVSIMLLCTIVWASHRATRLSGINAGLLAATKQYLIFVFPLTFLLPPFSANGSESAARRKNFLVASATALLVTLPFALWNISAFLKSTVILHIRQSVRLDALNYVAAAKVWGGYDLPTWLGFIAAAAALVFCLCRAPRTASGFAASVALVQSTFFVLGKQAFANYYYLIFAALCCATAAAHFENNIVEDGGAA